MGFALSCNKPKLAFPYRLEYRNRAAEVVGVYLDLLLSVQGYVVAQLRQMLDKTYTGTCLRM
jgi:hypothetical protein